MNLRYLTEEQDNFDFYFDLYQSLRYYYFGLCHLSFFETSFILY